MDIHVLHPAGSTGNSRASIKGVHGAQRAAVLFDITAVGGTPTISWRMEGLPPGGDATVTAEWQPVGMLTASGVTAVSEALVVATTVSRAWRYLDFAADLRFYDALCIITSANTNVTYNSKLFLLGV